MVVRAASLPVLPEASVFHEAIDRPRIRITIVEFSDLVRQARFCGILLVLFAHSDSVRHSKRRGDKLLLADNLSAGRNLFVQLA